MSIAAKCTCGYSVSGICVPSVKECKEIISAPNVGDKPAEQKEAIADNFVSQCCIGEKCPCGKDATKKIQEVILSDDPHPERHGYSQYVCSEHFDLFLRPYLKKDQPAEQPAIPTWFIDWAKSEADRIWQACEGAALPDEHAEFCMVAAYHKLTESKPSPVIEMNISEANRLRRLDAQQDGYDDFCEAHQIPYNDECSECSDIKLPAMESGSVIELLCHTLEELEKMYADEWTDYVTEQVHSVLADAKSWQDGTNKIPPVIEIGPEETTAPTAAPVNDNSKVGDLFKDSRPLEGDMLDIMNKTLERTSRREADPADLVERYRNYVVRTGQLDRASMQRWLKNNIPTSVPTTGEGEQPIPEDIRQWIEAKIDQRTEEFKKREGVDEVSSYAYLYGGRKLAEDMYRKMQEEIRAEKIKTGEVANAWVGTMQDNSKLESELIASRTEAAAYWKALDIISTSYQTETPLKDVADLKMLAHAAIKQYPQTPTK